MGSTSAGAQAVQRAMAVLTCFQDGGPPLSASDIARRLGLSGSTAHRLAQALAGSGFLEQDPQTARYRLGPSVTELGRLSFHQRGLHRVTPELNQLARVTSATVDLAMRNGKHAVILLGGSVDPDSAIGLRRPLHSTALGKVLLAWAAPPGDDLTLLGSLPPQTDRTITDPGELRAEIEKVRENGYALNDGESAYGVRTLAVPVLDRAEHARYALAVRATPRLITEARIGWFVSHALACARALEVLLLPPSERRIADVR
ncbi:IclR family transcriptional regulator [Microbispora sp. NPDC046933]|uniref:IclR family transcriptional regulator n=1 Tax=Microbispora sp. NPDC046933 TaxID=3155618 RepID=UPI0033D87ECB